MKKLNKFFIFLFFCVFQVWTDLADAPVLISLGWGCEAANALRTFGLRKEAFPFDWITTKDFNSVLSLIQDKFENFLNPKYLTIAETQKWAVHNTFYNFNFVHDFPSPTSLSAQANVSAEFLPGGLVVANYLDSLGAIQEKYNRRIDRFMQALTGTRQVMFF